VRAGEPGARARRVEPDVAPEALVVHPAHVLDREAKRPAGVLRRGRRVLEDFEQRRPLVPAHRLAPVDHHVARERRHREHLYVGEPHLLREGGGLVADAFEGGPVVADEVHLVHRDHDVGDVHQTRDV